MCEHCAAPPSPPAGELAPGERQCSCGARVASASLEYFAHRKQGHALWLPFLQLVDCGTCRAGRIDCLPPTAATFVAAIDAGVFRRVGVVLGAGASTAAGIPDFRSPGSGVYANAARYGVDAPEDLFSAAFFEHNPVPFNDYLRDFTQGHRASGPTALHFALAALRRRGVVRTVVTQNVDGLEADAGLDRATVTYIHGSMGAAPVCGRCGRETASNVYFMRLRRGRRGDVVRCEWCATALRPGIVFYGEKTHLGDAPTQLRMCDLLLIMGTSLGAEPVRTLCCQTPAGCPRVLVNRTPVALGARALEPGPDWTYLMDVQEFFPLSIGLDVDE